MRIVVVGLGQIGKELAKELIEAGHELIVIDVDKKEVENFTNMYDSIGIVGSGASKEIQTMAKAKNADVLIAVSPSDEVNIMSCITAKILGTRYTIARVTAAEYIKDEEYLTKDIGIDMVINSEYDTAKEIVRFVTYPTNIKTGAFANGKVDVAEIKIKEDSPLANLKMTDVKEKLGLEVIVASIIRDNKLIVPRGNVVIKEDDEVCIIARSNTIYALLKKLNLIEKPVKSIMIVGCGKTGEYLLSRLENMKIEIKIIESDKKRCIELAEKFPEATVIHGNAIDSEMLTEEGINDFDCTISLTDKDETNLVVTLFAWSCKVRKLITKITSLTYKKMINNVEIGRTISPHFVVLSSVHRFIRGIEDAERGTNAQEEIKSIHRFAKNMAEAIEFQITGEFPYIGKSLKELKIKKEILIAFIIREGKVIIPNGETFFMQGDKVIVTTASILNLKDLGTELLSEMAE